VRLKRARPNGFEAYPEKRRAKLGAAIAASCLFSGVGAEDARNGVLDEAVGDPYSGGVFACLFIAQRA
jgi:hypothetical protein